MDRTIRYILYVLLFLGAICIRSIALRSLFYSRTKEDRKATPLKDAMHDVIPTVSEDVGKIKEIFTFLPLVLFIFFIVKEKNYRVLFDFIKLFAMIMIIRSLSFYLTTLPDASQRCDPSIIVGINGGCSDLLFSGHTAIQLLSILYLYYYSETWNRYSDAIKIPFLSIIPMNMYLILARRDHYSIDILYAFMVTYGMFYFNHTCFKPGMLCVKD